MSSSQGISSGAILEGLVRGELVATPIEAWGFFFPFHVGVWRFSEELRPGALGPVRAAFLGEPVFEGRGAVWFCDVLCSDPEYLNLVEHIMYQVTRDAPLRVIEAVRERGYFRADELPGFAAADFERVASRVLESVDEAIRGEAIV